MGYTRSVYLGFISPDLQTGGGPGLTLLGPEELSWEGHMEEGQQLSQLAERLGTVVLRGLGARSAWALNTGLSAADTDGIGGVVVLQIPPRTKDRIDVSFTAGVVDVVTRWGPA